jgi:hypothetical protein
MWLWGPMGGFVAVPALLVVQSVIMHVFPTTADVPEAVRRRLEMRATADVRAVPPTEPPPEPTVAELKAVAKPRRSRKAAAPASS